MLCQALRQRQPALLVSDTIAKQWLRQYGGVRVQSRIDNSAHLERDWGVRIREHLALDASDPGGLWSWMLTQGVSVPTRVCQAWLTRDWASSGNLFSCDAVEKEFGDRLRLAEYKHSFADGAAAQILSGVLLERQRPVRVSALVLRQ